ncbi:hypothetical protein Tco_0790327 [Tanacetum coccineum]
MGELGNVLGRWFGKKTVGEGGLRYWREWLRKDRKGNPFFQLADEDDEASTRIYSSEEEMNLILERAKRLSLEALQEKREGEGDEADLGTS